METKQESTPVTISSYSPAFVGYGTIVRKDLTRIIRIWGQTLLPPVITMSLYFIVFGGFIGSQISRIEGFTYMQFIVPGLVMMTIITNSYQNTVSTFYFAKWQRTIDELLVSPMPTWAIVAGYVTGGVLRGFITGILVVGVSLFFTKLSIVSVGVLIGAALLTAILFSLAGLVNAINAKSIDAISIIPNFVLTPLTYLGGVFYSISLLPPVFQKISLVNPILYMVNAFRYGFLGVSDVPVARCFLVMGAFTLVFIIWTGYLFNKGAGLRK